MSAAPVPPLGAPRSMGMKLLVVAILTLSMGIPALFVAHLVTARADRAKGVQKEIGATVGGRETFLGPVLAVSTVVQGADSGRETALRILFPTASNITVQTTTSIRHRSLFTVPIYRALLKFRSTFEISSREEAALKSPTSAE